MKNLLKNRIVIGLICIILSLIICFGLTPMFNNALKSKVSLVRVNTEIHKGDQITEKMLTTVEVGGYNLPGNVVYKAEDVVGKYANTDMCKGDYFLNKDWYETLMFTGFGKVLLAISGTVVFISVAAVSKHIRPIEYKR